jgi:hypothetical protein
MTITTIGLDLAKSVFQAHGIDDWRHGAGQEAALQADVALLFQAATVFDRRRGLRNG